MSSECYFYRIPDGRIASIRPSGRVASHWELWLGHTFFCDVFGSVQDAVSSAYDHDFSDERQTQMFAGVHVPDHLQRWSTCSHPDELPIKDSTRGRSSRPPSTCPPRPWKRGGLGRFG